MSTANHTISAKALPCTELLEKYGILRSELEHATNKEFSLPLNFINCYDKYFLLYWGRDFLLSQLEGSKGLIEKDGITYEWILTRDLSLGKIASMPARQYALSFRKPRPEFGIFPKVLIS